MSRHSATVSAMTAAVAAPAALFLGAGTAQATARFDAIPTPGGVTVVVHSDQPDPPGGNCFYSARADGNPIGKPAPIANVPFFLPQGAEATLWFPSFPTDSLWTISVSCDTGGTQFGFARY